MCYNGGNFIGGVENLKLDNKNIADVINEIEKFFETLKISKADRIKLCFLLEEALLRFQEKFGESHEFNFVVKKWLGTPRVLIRVKGSPYNPLEDNSETNLFSENIMRNLLSYESAGTVYRYENGVNEISAFSTRETRKIRIPGGATALSVILAILAAFLVGQLPPNVQKIIVENLTTPILDRLLGTILTFSIPMIFISITASICSIEDVTMLNEVGAKVLKRFFAIMLSIAVVSIGVNALVFPVIKLESDGDFLAANSSELQKIFELFLNMIPQNIVDPFLNGNVLQLIILAVLLGISITILGNRVSTLKNLIMVSKMAIFEIIEIVFRITPLIIFLCLFKTIMNGSIEDILKVWKIVATEYVLFALCVGIALLKVKVNYGVKILDFLRKIQPALMISLATGSGTASMAKNIELCKKELKLEGNICDFYIPLSNALCPTTMITGIVTCVFFAAEFSDVQISIANLFIIGFLAIQFGFFSSGVSSGTLTILGLLFTQLGLPLDSIGTILIADIFVINIASVVALIIRDCDLIDISHKLQFPSKK